MRYFDILQPLWQARCGHVPTLPSPPAGPEPQWPNPSLLPVEPEFRPSWPPAEPEVPGVRAPAL